MEQRTPNPEIDILELLAKFFRVLKRNKILAVLCLLAGLLAGLLASVITEETVSASMMISTDLISEDESKFLADQFNKREFIVGLTNDQQHKIVTIDYDVKKSEVAGKNTSIYLKITAVVNDNSVLPVLERLLVDYLNQTEPIKRNRSERERFYVEMIKKIDIELLAMEKVKSGLDTKTKISLLAPSDLFAKTVELYDNRLHYEIALDDIKSVHIVKSFGTLTKSNKWSKTIYAIGGIFLGAVFLAITLFIKFFNGYYKQFEKTNLN